MHPFEGALLLASGFLLGNILASFFSFAPSLLLGLTALFLPFGWFFCSRSMLLYGTLLLSGLLAGAFLTNSAYQDLRGFTLPPEPFQGSVRIVTYPEPHLFFQEVILEPLACAPESACAEGRILWQAPLSFKGHLGERFAFTCPLAKPENFSSDFDYVSFLGTHGIRSVCKEGNPGEQLPLDVRGTFWAALGRAHQVLEDSLTNVIPEPEAGLAKGLVLGGSDYLPEEQKIAFQRIGMTHIVAVSGYNIMLVAEGVLFVALASGFWRRQALLVAALGIFVFIFFVGAPASAVRAGVMALLTFLALHQGRLSRPFPLLLFAAVLMLVFNPLLLRYDVGFQLSFLALVGIFFAVDWYRLPGPEQQFAFWQEAAKVTLFVEFFVLPAIFYHFHLFSWFSFFANLILLPVVPVAMLTSCAVAILGLLFPGAAALYAFIAYLPLTFLLRFAEFFASLSFIALPLPPVSLFWLAFWYTLLVLYCLFLALRRKRRWYAYAFTLPDIPVSRPRDSLGRLLSFLALRRRGADRDRLS